MEEFMRKGTRTRSRQNTLDIKETEVQKESEDGISSEECQNVKEVDHKETTTDENHSALWKKICKESDENKIRILEPLESDKREEPELPERDTPSWYLNKKLFPVLLPGMESMLLEARKQKCLEIQKKYFNGADYLAELLYNKNPAYPERERNWTEIFSIPFAKNWLRFHPRPIYPKSWLWTEDEAATIIQASIRGFLVRCKPEVEEMRQFWKNLNREREEEEQRKMEEEEEKMKTEDEEEEGE